MPQYLLLLYDPRGPAGRRARRGVVGLDAVPRRLPVGGPGRRRCDGAGQLRLRPQATATTIRPSSPGSTPLVTDGPFPEALGGCYPLECRVLNQALELAEQCPVQSGGVEVRPVWDVTGR
jgi:YCII-related domain-containing protein